MGRSELVKEHWVVRASVAGLLGVLCFLAGFSILTQRSVEDTSRRADRAMRLSAIYQDAAIYGPDMEPGSRSAQDAEDEHHSRTLASALARAVDAKDSYTRSHCQTVSQLCAVIAAELGFDGDRLA